jgi:hypothetical protein
VNKIGVIQVQVQHLELLAKLYIRRNRHDLASQVWEVLAVRKGGLGDQAISLSQRQEAFQNAVIEVRCFSDIIEDWVTGKYPSASRPWGNKSPSG